MDIELETNSGFQELLSLISNEINNGNLQLSNPGEKKRISAYWNIGRIIQNHLSQHSYDNNTINIIYETLSKKLYLGNRTLYYTTQFVNLYPEISALPEGLFWSHYKILFSIEPAELRKECEKLLLTGNYSIRDFFELVKTKKENLIQFVQSNLYFTRGIPYLYSVRKKSGKSSLDLGFFTYLDLFQDKLSGYPDKTAVLSTKSDSDYIFQPLPERSKLLFTYKAIVIDIIDGDTIKLSIDLGFNINRTEIFRLNKIDAPEMNTETGLRAKNFVIEKLSAVPFIAVKTYHKDKYARYLADIFYLPNPSNLEEIIQTGTFLNQELIDNSLAVKYYID